MVNYRIVPGFWYPFYVEIREKNSGWRFLKGAHTAQEAQVFIDESKKVNIGQIQ